MEESKERQGFTIYHSLKESVEHLENEEAGILLKAIFDYSIEGKLLQSTDRVLLITFSMAKGMIDLSKERYKERCRKNKENAEKRWAKEREEKERREKGGG